MNIEHEWTEAAIIDDSMVAELLLRLNHVTPPFEPSSSLPARLHWSVRQRRSKSASVKPAPRDSPTNPLSWSGATSFSGEVGGAAAAAADGSCEESSRLSTPLSKPHTSTRSKVNTTSETTSSKRSRKKRTLTELKDEEILLIKERKQLKRELAQVRSNLEKQRDTNQNLKRMKLDVEQLQANERGKTVLNDGIAGQSQQKAEPSNPALPIILESVQRNVALSSPFPENCYFREQKVQVAYQESKFVLPDLNLPSEEDPRAEIMCLS